MQLLGECKATLEDQANDVEDGKDLNDAGDDHKQELNEILVTKEGADANQNLGNDVNTGDDEEKDLNEQVLFVKKLVELHWGYLHI